MTVEFAAHAYNRRTLLLYLTHEDDAVQISRIKALHELFGDNLLVIADDQIKDSMGFGDVTIIREQPITETRRFSHFCCSQEKAMMWLIDNAGLYSHAWVMENDVWFRSTEVIAAFLQKYSGNTEDLLHQNAALPPHYDTASKHLHYLNNSTLIPEARFSAPYYKGLFNLYRVSSNMVSALNNWRLKNAGQWTFFEPLIATLAMQESSITSSAYSLENPSVKMRHRPCFTSVEADILHPVKGNFSAPFHVDRARLEKELKSLIPMDVKLIVMDEDQLEVQDFSSWETIPFTERNGRYWGPPKNSFLAIREFEAKRGSGAQYLAICWPAFWIFRHYCDFEDHIVNNYKCVYQSKRVHIYDVRHSVS